MYGILFLLVLGLIAALTIGYRLRRLRDEAERQMGGGNGYYRRYSYRSDRRDGYGRTVREGDVEVQQTQPQEKRVRSDVGDYVDDMRKPYEMVAPESGKIEISIGFRIRYTRF